MYENFNNHYCVLHFRLILVDISINKYKFKSNILSLVSSQVIKL